MIKLGIPVLNDAIALESLLKSIDVEADVLVIANRIGPMEARVADLLMRYEQAAPCPLITVTVDWVDGNLGVSGSWNRIIDHFKGDCFISNSDILFANGVLAEAGAEVSERSAVAIRFLHSYACFYVTSAFTRELGWFDENFYPAYQEDQEMSLRRAALKKAGAIFKMPSRERISHAGSQTLRQASEGQRRFIEEAKELCTVYMRRRWGSLPPPGELLPEKVFPFDDRTLEPSDWTLDLTMREKIAQLCKLHTGFACPIVYHRRSGGILTGV